MYLINNPEKKITTNGIVWGKNGKLLKFSNGSAETSDKKIADELAQIGFVVEEEKGKKT